MLLNKMSSDAGTWTGLVEVSLRMTGKSVIRGAGWPASTARVDSCVGASRRTRPSPPAGPPQVGDSGVLCCGVPTRHDRHDGCSLFDREIFCRGLALRNFRRICGSSLHSAAHRAVGLPPSELFGLSCIAGSRTSGHLPYPTAQAEEYSVSLAGLRN